MARRTLTAAGVLALGLLTGGCIQIGGDATPDVRRHALDVLPVTTADGVALPALAVRDFAARRRYDVRVVLRSPDGALAFLEFDRWVEEPAEAMTTVIREELARSGAFRSVTSAGAAFEAELVLEGVLLQFDVVAADDGAETARLEVRLDIAQIGGGSVLHSGRFSAERPVIPDRGGLGAAMSECAADVVRQALADWTSAK